MERAKLFEVWRVDYWHKAGMNWSPWGHYETLVAARNGAVECGNITRIIHIVKEEIS